MQLFGRWRAAAAISMFALSGCATMDSGSFVDRDVDFHGYRTYNWAPADARSGSDPRIAKNAGFNDQLQGEIEKQLAVKGFTGPTRRRPDLLVRYRTAVNERIEVDRTDTAYPDRTSSAYGYCSMDCTSRTLEYETATLIIDIVDARQRKVVWRGWAMDRLDAVLDNPDRMERKIHEAVTEMMAKFPGRT